MTTANSQVQDFAERLIAYETRQNKSSGTNTPTAFPVCEKLRPHLATLMGNTGVHALLLRALARARAEIPSLRAVQVNADGSLGMVEKLDVQVNPDALVGGSVVLVAQLLGLLVDFIGENLMLRIVCDVWPKLVLDDSFLRKIKHEKTI